MIKLYTTHCPKCNILKQKLDSKNIQYEEVVDVDRMVSLGIMNVPMLDVDGNMLNFLEANKWINGGGN